MNQSKLGSMIESVLNAALGYGIAVASQVVIFPLFGIHVPFSDNLLIGVYFTGISLVRSYVLRRWFNGKLHAAAQRLAAAAETQAEDAPGGLPKHEDCYDEDGCPRQCPACGSTDIDIRVEDFIDFGVPGGGPATERSYRCSGCGALVGYWAYGSYDPSFMEPMKGAT